MYKQIVTTFCGEPYVLTCYAPPVERGQVIVRIDYVYFSTIDRALTSCALVTDSSMRVLGTSGSGRVIDTGVDADPTLEGKYVATNPLCSSVAPIERDGAAQELYPVDQRCIHALPPSFANDPLAPLAPLLSASHRQLEELYAQEVLIVGREFALLPFALYARKNSSRLWIVAKHILWPDIVRGDHVSLYDVERKVDVVVIAEPDPSTAWLALSMLREGGLTIIYPSTPITPTLLHILSAKRIRVELLELEHIENGLKLLEELRQVLEQRIRFEPFSSEAVKHAPCIAYLREQRNLERNAKRFSK